MQSLIALCLLVTIKCFSMTLGLIDLLLFGRETALD